LPLFSGHYLSDNNTNRNVLIIEFSQQISSIALTFATADFNQTELPTVIQLTAYDNSTRTLNAGSATARGNYGSGTMPMGALSFTSAGTPFTLVEITLPPQPMGATAFLVDNITVTMSVPYADVVQEVYVGYYQRPADPEGLLYWADRLNSTNGDLNAIIEAYANSAESRALYGTIDASNIENVVNAIYMALFNRIAEAGGLAYYVSGFNSGQFTAATIMLNVLNGAQNQDLVTVNNKLAAANLFTMTIDPELDGKNFQVTYAGDGDAISARAFLATVMGDPATVPTQDTMTAWMKNNIADPGDPILSR
jgi:hypothetical protein